MGGDAMMGMPQVGMPSVGCCAWGCRGWAATGGGAAAGMLQVGHGGSAVPLVAGGLLVGFPENPPASRILHGPELQYYIQRFEKSGFR